MGAGRTPITRAFAALAAFLLVFLHTSRSAWNASGTPSSQNAYYHRQISETYSSGNLQLESLGSLPHSRFAGSFVDQHFLFHFVQAGLRGLGAKDPSKLLNAIGLAAMAAALALAASAIPPFTAMVASALFLTASASWLERLLWERPIAWVLAYALTALLLVRSRKRRGVVAFSLSALASAASFEAFIALPLAWLFGRRPGGDPGERNRRLAVLGGGLVFGLFLNPKPLARPIYFFELAFQNFFRERRILEWKGAIDLPGLLDWHGAVFLAIASWYVFAKRGDLRARGRELLGVLALLALALKFQRFAPYMAVFGFIEGSRAAVAWSRSAPVLLKAPVFLALLAAFAWSSARAFSHKGRGSGQAAEWRGVEAFASWFDGSPWRSAGLILDDWAWWSVFFHENPRTKAEPGYALFLYEVGMPSRLSQYLAWRSNPSAANARRLARAFGTDLILVKSDSARAYRMESADETYALLRRHVGFSLYQIHDAFGTFEGGRDQGPGGAAGGIDLSKWTQRGAGPRILRADRRAAGLGVLVCGRFFHQGREVRRACREKETGSPGLAPKAWDQARLEELSAWEAMPALGPALSPAQAGAYSWLAAAPSGDYVFFAAEDFVFRRAEVKRFLEDFSVDGWEIFRARSRVTVADRAGRSARLHRGFAEAGAAGSAADALALANRWLLRNFRADGGFVYGRTPAFAAQAQEWGKGEKRRSLHALMALCASGGVLSGAEAANARAACYTALKARTQAITGKEAVKAGAGDAAMLGLALLEAKEAGVSASGREDEIVREIGAELADYLASDAAARSKDYFALGEALLFVVRAGADLARHDLAAAWLAKARQEFAKSHDIFLIRWFAEAAGALFSASRQDAHQASARAFLEDALSFLESTLHPGSAGPHMRGCPAGKALPAGAPETPNHLSGLFLEGVAPAVSVPDPALSARARRLSETLLECTLRQQLKWYNSNVSDNGIDLEGSWRFHWLTDAARIDVHSHAQLGVANFLRYTEKR